jgi:hypothetical protein
MPEERVQELVARASADLAVRGLTVAAVPALIAVSAAAPAAAVPLVAATLAADLGPIDVPFLRRANGDLGVFAERTPPPIARLAAADTLRRAMALRRDLFFSNDWIRWRVPSMAGFHPAVPIGWADLRRTGLLGHYPMMRALAIGYVSGEVRGVSDTALYERIAASPPDDPVWRVRGALPRAFAVRRVVPATGDEEELAMLAAPDFDPSIVAVTSERAAQADYPGSAACALRWRESGTDRLVLETEAPAAAFVVIADTWFPGWRARVDDTDAAIVRVDHMLRGIAVPAGRHHLTLTYEPEGWRASTRVTWVAWMLWLAGGVLALWMARRPRSATAAAG